MQRKIMLIALLLFILSRVISAQAKESNPPKYDPNVIQPHTIRVIPVEISVTDRKGNDIKDLTRESIKIYENGVEQENLLFRPITYLLQGKLCIKYKLAYTPINEFADGTLRNVKVKVKLPGRKKAKVMINPESYIATPDNLPVRKST